jgi:hypothetical protein
MAEKAGAFKKSKHKWWRMISWVREQDQSMVEFIFYPKTQLWKIGSRLGRVVAGLEMRTEFFPKLASGNEHEARPNYCWGEDLVYFPFRLEMHDDGTGVLVPVQVPDLPEPIVKWTKSSFPSANEWRSDCFLYGTKGWKSAMGEPKSKDRWKKKGMKYHPVDGHPINVKAHEKKYKTDVEFQEAHAAWVDKMQDEGRLPSDEEYGSWLASMSEEGCAWQYVANEN